MFANVTNHPQTRWGEKQRQAAIELGREIVDFPFPNVSPEASTEEVEGIAEELAEKITAEGATVALVQGEFTCTVALVKALQHRGVKVLAATSERKVVEKVEGAEVKKVAVFRFVRFREYPRL